MKIYISGPISGLPIEVYTKAFKEAEDTLLMEGWEVVNPVTLDHDHEAASKIECPKERWAFYMDKCISALLRCDAIYMLKGWEKSKGASVEMSIANAFDFKIIYQ